MGVANSNTIKASLRVYATHVDLEGFTVPADRSDGTQLYACGVSWMAIGHWEDSGIMMHANERERRVGQG